MVLRRDRSTTRPSAGQIALRRWITAIRMTPIPAFPLVQDAALEARGFAILELSTRLSHVVRQSEILALTDRNQLTRQFSLDIDMTRLAERDFLALAPIGRWNATQERYDEAEHTWLPVASQTRSDLAPIIVTDGDGRVLPRMPAGDVAMAMAAALVRLFDLLLRPAIQRAESELARAPKGSLTPAQEDEKRLHEAVALLGESVKSVHLTQAALRRLVVEGWSGLRGAPGASNSITNDTVRIGDEAVEGLSALADRSAGQSFGAFLELLNFCIESYPLMVLMPRTALPGYLKFEVPSISASTSWLKETAQVATPVRNFPVTYWTQASRATDSFHATLQVDDQLKVRRLVASSDFDQPHVERLVSDMEGLAVRYDSLEKAASEILENELQSIAERLASLCERRCAEEQVYARYLAARGAPRRVRRKGRRAERLAEESADASLEELIDGFTSFRRRSLDHLALFAQGLRQGRFTTLARGSGDTGINPDRLRRLAKKVTDLRLGWDLVVDNNPRENSGHVYWHRTHGQGHERSLEPVQVGVQAILVDDPPSLSGSVSRMATAVLATVVATLVLLFDGWSWLDDLTWRIWANDEDGVSVHQADAVVTVLLLVPGLMLTRLHIPSTNTVLGQIRSQTRVLAYAAFAAPAALATYVAAAQSVDRAVPQATVAFLVVLMAYCWTSGAWTWWTQRQTAMDSRPTPQWVRDQLGRQSFGLQLHRDVVFRASRL